MNTLNQIKIRDIMSVIKNNFDLKNELHLLQIEYLANTENRLLENATDDDLKYANELYIKHTLGIKYYPSSSKKVFRIKNKSITLPIDSQLEETIKLMDSGLPQEY